MATSSNHRGWLLDRANGRLAAVYDGTEVFDFDADDIAFAQAATFASTINITGVATLAAATGVLGTVTYTWPTDDGDAGEQLQTNGSGVLTWEAAGSLREVKELLGKMDPVEALARLKGATVHRFHYREGARPTTGDFDTEYVGVMADEAPWAMHHNGRIFNPVSAFGHAVAAIQALASKVEELESKLATQGA